MLETIGPLIATLREARDFEDAATKTLSAMLKRASSALASSTYKGRILRGMVHLRPDDVYTCLVTLENGASSNERNASSAHDDQNGAPRRLYSATAWRWIVKHRCALSIDVTAGRVQTHPTGPSSVVVEAPCAGGPFNSKDTKQRLLRRDASHLYVLPLLAPTGTVDGMISIEACCQEAIGRDFIWPQCGEDLGILAGVAGPYLVSKPLPPAPAATTDDYLPVIGAKTARLVDMLRAFVQQDEPILLLGPTGAGKSKLAVWCHKQSPRRDRPLESIVLSTFPEDLQQGALFGWKKGAYTGAVGDNSGCLGRAEGGTLFIDEIDKLSLNVQASLLKVLDEGFYRPLGADTGDKQADVRFIIGANTDLPAAVREGRFREDLYYRISVFPVQVPPLEERTDEISSWAQYFAHRRHRNAHLSTEAEDLLRRARWPGNLRQLENIVCRAHALARIKSGSATAGVTIDACHVKEAFGCDPGATSDPSLTALLLKAAESFVCAALHGAPGRDPLDLDLADAFRGFVLGAATLRLGSKEKAFRLLGKESLLKDRNHHKPFKLALKQVAELYRMLGEGASPFKDLIEPEQR